MTEDIQNIYVVSTVGPDLVQSLVCDLEPVFLCRLVLTRFLLSDCWVVLFEGSFLSLEIFREETLNTWRYSAGHVPAETRNIWRYFAGHVPAGTQDT